MLCGLLLEYSTVSDWVREFPSYSNRASLKVVSAPLWMAALSLYTLGTFGGLLMAGLVSNCCPSLFTPLFEALLDKVAPSETFCPRPSGPPGKPMLPTKSDGGTVAHSASASTRAQ